MQYIGSELYFAVDKGVIIVPTLVAPAGFGIASNKYIILGKGYTKEQLADGIMQALSISATNESEDCSKKFWIEATGIKGFATFSKKYKCVSVSYLAEKDEYKVTAQKRYKDGSYGIDADDVALREKTYPGRPSIDTIADQVLEALKIDG